MHTAVDPDKRVYSAASDKGLHCLTITLLGVSRLKPVNIYSYSLGTDINSNCSKVSTLKSIPFKVNP